ncbi:hypothetical protein IEQ34_019329 [Dendrobium chrysotoxum]|uniref:Uncharacterized protein n=1 Tax=Dendrobium chrysotoxum TaxID=161865 RepID=A0AAV7G8E8_DENCH|nr:hypothetical protein IEQ34_019329 [Dendrobium chrysotoxum]
MLTSLEEDKKGFHQVIDLISSSHKIIISHNWLHDFTFIHEKSLGLLPEMYFVPIELEVLDQVEDGNNSHGNNVVKLTFLFAKLNMLLKNAPSSRSAL